MVHLIFGKGRKQVSDLVLDTFNLKKDKMKQVQKLVKKAVTWAANRQDYLKRIIS